MIGHEITHSFDDATLRIDEWDKDVRKKYEEAIQCFVDQYSNTRVTEIEEADREKGIETIFYLNGNLTRDEDIA